MSNFNLLSDKITIFPASQRTQEGYYKTSRLLSEKNLNRSITQLVDRKSFVISTSTEESVFEFSINGYYIVANTDALLELLSSSLSVAQKVIASIIVDENDVLQGVDTESNGDRIYDGVQFTIVLRETVVPESEAIPDTNRTKYNLVILEGNSSGPVIPRDSTVKFNSSSFPESISRLADLTIINETVGGVTYIYPHVPFIDGGGVN